MAPRTRSGRPTAATSSPGRARLRRPGARGDARPGGGSRGAEVPEIDPLRPLAPRPPHFAAKAKSCIFLFMEGGPSHIDLFDPKPELTKHARRAPAAELRQGLHADGRRRQHAAWPAAASSPSTARAGLWVSDWYPHVAEVVDEIALVRSCWADGVNHVGSVCQMNTGSILAGRPSLGALGDLRPGHREPGPPRVRRDERRRRAGRRPEELGQRLAPGDLPGHPLPQGRPADPPPRPPEGGRPTAQQQAKLDLIADLDRRHAEARARRLAARRPDRRL